MAEVGEEGKQQNGDSLWSPEHDWILQFDRLLSPKRNKKASFNSASLAATPNAAAHSNNFAPSPASASFTPDWRNNFKQGSKQRWGSFCPLPPPF